MGLLDRLTGRSSAPKDSNKQGEQQAAVAQSAPAEEQPAAATSSRAAESELKTDLPSPSFGPPQLPSVDLAAANLPSLTVTPSTSGKLYDPYEGLSGIGRKGVAFKLPEQPEFVFEEEAAVRRRGWTENLQFYTGTCYLLGGATGVALGAYNYATVKPEIPLDTVKLKLNRLLNQMGSKAKPFGNGSAVMGLYFASFESVLSNYFDNLPETASTIAAGTLSGALFRSPRGPRQAAAAGLVGAAGGLAVAALRTVFPSL